MQAPMVESFSITHAALLDGFSGADSVDIYGVRSGSIEIDSDSYSNTGDDAIQSVWNWFNLATLTVESGYVSFDMLSKIAASTVTTSNAGGTNDYWNIPLWNQNSLNVPPMSVLFRTSAKKADGSTGFLDFILYKVQFDPMKFDGPSYKNGLTVSYSGKCTMSATDEIGNVLAQPAIGRLRFSTRPIVVVAGSITVVDNSNGTYTISGIGSNPDNTYVINYAQLVDNGNGTYTITY